RVGFAWDLHGTGTDVFRGSYGLYYVQILQQSTYQRNFLAQSVIQATSTTTNSAVGVGPLATFVFGVTPIAASPVTITSLPAVGGESFGVRRARGARRAAVREGDGLPGQLHAGICARHGRRGRRHDEPGGPAAATRFGDGRHHRRPL